MGGRTVRHPHRAGGFTQPPPVVDHARDDDHEDEDGPLLPFGVALRHWQKAITAYRARRAL